ALGAAGLLLVARAGRPDRAAGAVPLRRPDDASLLLVTIDTTRADRLEPYGGPEGSTPHLARMAEEGVVFDHAYSVAPITLVAHSSLLTGLYPPQHGVRNNGLHRLEEDVETLAERLSGEGFRTAAFVSAAVLERQYGLDQGFEVYDDDLSAGRERHPRMVPDRPAEATVAAAADWLASLDDGERFFLWVHLYDPHAPYSPPPPWRDDHRDDLYQGEIAYLDHWMGKLFAHPRLRAGDLVTAVVGDHGESLGEHGEQTHALLAYDATLHVPLLLRWPGAPRGRRVAPAVSQVDLVPTLLDLAGVDPPAAAAGRSLLPLVAGAPAPPRGLYSETYLPFYTYGWAKLRVWRQGLAKYVEAPTPELFDLSRDPRELTNLHGSEPGLAHDLARDLGEFLAEVGGGEAEAELALDSESVEKLRALGYLAVGSGPGAAARADRDRPDPKAVIDLHTGLQKARRLADDGLHQPAIDELERVLRRDPGNLAALIDLAASQAATDELDAAVATVERALALDPDYPRLYLQLAAIELRRGDPAKAAELADRALELDPRLPEAWIQKAQIAARSRREGAAAAVVEEAVSAVGEHPRLLAVAAQLVDLPAGDLDRAEDRARRALDLDPFLPAAWRLLGEVQERRGQEDEAAASYREGLRRRPDDAELHGRLGMLLARDGHSPAAPAHLREAIRLRSEPDPELHVALGAWLAGQGDLAAAEVEYRRVLEGRPRHPGARNNLAIVLSQTGRRAEAREMLEALTAERPRLADPWNNLAA
ncbi:MAG TPA: sulfatase-like hydrolase/transferase, partial [Thermoanaerobaculia bacterium]|nr:sulfatase-like hydrolase/transferase [Thermoanaerobaculia bacterium]